MKVIKAKNKDIFSLVELCKEVQEYHIKLNPGRYRLVDIVELTDWFQKLFTVENIKIFILKNNGAIIGYVILNIIERKENLFIYSQKFIEIDQIGIRKQFRGKGYCKLLIEEAKKYAESLNINTVVLSVLAQNNLAVSAYIKNGFISESIKMMMAL